ncbi:hypothetical protein Tco_1265853 [Tanacetum coccineum]
MLLSKGKEREKPLKGSGLCDAIAWNFLKQILEAQTKHEACGEHQEGGMLESAREQGEDHPINKGVSNLSLVDKKSYADLKRKPMEFQVRDKVMLKVSPWKGVLELPQELSRVHNTFHVSNLKKCYSDDPLVVPLEGLQVDDKLHFVEEPVEVMDREVKQLRRSCCSPMSRFEETLGGVRDYMGT